MTASEPQYVSRGGVKLAAALRAFRIDPHGWTAIDLGSHVGGFVDCLLKHGAARVHAVDPGYGILDYALRRDPRVVVHERTNALRFVPPEQADLVTVDVGWTALRLILPLLRRALRPEAPGGAIVLVKPQYEAAPAARPGGVVAEDRLAEVLVECRGEVARIGFEVRAEIESPLRGHGGNREFLWHLFDTVTLRPTAGAP
ncbi:MAG: TlyA family rRNA (cytidine-2'-O)-methyltransferase [Phycisphaerales bacterium]|nr:TlyA family rRNA (cytidine-2'-O)-methyltransferase [Phycisphaerales bacterium]